MPQIPHKTHFTAKELAGLPGMPSTERAIQIMAKREKWPFQKRSGRGGGREYPLSCLPPETRAALSASNTIIESPDTATTYDPAALATMGLNPLHAATQAMLTAGRNRRMKVIMDEQSRQRMKELSLARFNQLPESKQQSGNARALIIKAATAFCVGAGAHPGSKEWMDRFVGSYNEGGFSDLPGWIRDEIPRISATSIYRWRREYNEGGMYALADGYAGKSGETTLTKDQQELCIAMQIQFPGCSLKKVVSALEARGMAAHIDTVRRFVKRWLKMNASLHLFLTNPDEWKNKHMFAFGNASEAVTRLNQIWEADSTPGDIMLEDGRHTVIGVIDVYSRRTRLLVTPTSKATAISALLRRCILEWGVMESLKTDNGQDYVAAHIERLLDDLEVEHILCPPFTPECKPHIERFLGVFSHGIVELLPGFIGHSVADRKAIEARKSFADRLMKRGTTVEVKLTSLEFQKICDRWVDAIYMHDVHGGLNGKAPAEMVRNWTAPIRQIVDERALDVLLHPVHSDGGMRYIGKKGVTIDSRNYISPEFSGHMGEHVRVLVDDTDIGRAYIFSETGEFICIAENREWQGLSSSDLAAHAKARQKAILLEQKKELKELVKKAKADTLPEDILRYREEKIATLIDFPKPSMPHITPALEEAAKAVLERETHDTTAPLEHRELPEHVIQGEKLREELHQKKIVSLAVSRQLRDISSPTDVYYMILDRIKSGDATGYQMRWKKDFEYWDETTKKVGLMKDDPFCLGDPEEGKIKGQESGNGER